MKHEMITYNENQLEKAKKAALSLSNSKSNGKLDIDALMHSDNLVEIEEGIRELNSFATKATLMSSIILYTCIFNMDLYKQSGLTWAEYIVSAKKRLGLDPREISEMLSGAGFFIEYNDKLMEKNYQLTSFRNIARAYLALELSGNVDEVINHLCSGESAEAFKAWYQSLKKPKAIEGPSSNFLRTDIVITKTSVSISGKNLFTISDNLPEEEQKKFMEYVTKIYSTIQEGYQPAVIPVYDKAEARKLLSLRDKNRKSR